MASISRVSSSAQPAQPAATTCVAPGEFAGTARWAELAFSAHIDQVDVPVNLAGRNGRRLVMAGEFHNSTAATFDDLLNLTRDTAPRRLGGLAGGFAGVVVDPATNTILLMTDPFGVRPVYYWSDHQRLAFATRLRDLESAAATAFKVDRLAIYHYLNFSYVPGPGTVFENVFVLPPGSIAICRNGSIEVVSYWDISYPADSRASEADLAAAMRRHLERAILASAPADVPQEAFGSFLSGGTDSGTISAVLARARSPLNAYSIAFSEDAYDELSYAKAFADQYSLNHHIVHLTADDLLASIPALVEDLDQPFGNPSLVATWRCTRLAKATGMSVLVAGDGGDELFGGNERYASDQIYRRYHRLPAPLRRAIHAGLRAMPGASFQLNRARNIAYRGMLPNPERFYTDDAFASKYWDTLARPALRDTVSRDASLDVVRGHFERAFASTEIDRLLYVDLKMAIWGNDLVKVTTAARVSGVRVRFPFLDPSLAAFTGSLPARLKVRGREKRPLFKRAVADLLPEVVKRKPKHGFGVPVAEWIRTDRRVREAVLDPILDRSSIVTDVLTRAGVQRLVDDHLESRWDHGTWLWALMMLARWGVERRAQDAGR